jgi:two-component system chemotaxis response regulator CheY
MKRVLDVGQCSPDHWSIKHLIEGELGAEIVQAHLQNEALEQLRAGKFDLVLVNRKFDADYSDGLELIRAIKADAALATVPVMLVSNYPEYQAEAVAAGALPGFGKAELRQPATKEKLSAILA